MNAMLTPSVGRRARLGTACALLTGLALVGCSSGGSGGGTLAAPDGVVAFAGDSEVTLSWTANPKAASSTIYWSTTPDIDKATANQITDAKAPFLHTGLSNLTTYYYLVTSVKGGGKEGKSSAEVQATPRVTAGQFKPTWADVTPTQVISIDHDPMQSDEANGLLLAAQIAALMPGARLEIGAGTWSMPDAFSIDLTATALAPIFIAAQAGARPVITRADATDAVIHVGASGGARYVALIGLEIADGGRGIDVWDAQELWLDLNLISSGGNTPISADNFDTQALFITRNQLDHAGGEGHGILLGTSDVMAITTNSVVAQNHISHCRGIDATGIWVRQGSSDNWIVENVVHDTDWPCILVAGTAVDLNNNNPPGRNTIERNVTYESRDNVIEVQSQAFVRNNLMINGNQGFSSHDDFDEVRQIEVVNNTIINTGRAVNLDNWAGKAGVVFANNVCYSQKAQSLRFATGSAGVTVEGNVVVGPTSGVTTGFIVGTGLNDFVDLDWKGVRRDATPSDGSPIIDSGEPTLMMADDLTGLPRDTTTNEAGALDYE